MDEPKKMSKLLGGVLGEVSQPRPGSAPPQVDEATGSTGLPGSSAALFTSPLSTSGLGLPPSSKDEAFLSDPDYIRFYYSNKNLNPRLTPPTMAGSPQRDLASPWSGATAAKPLETSGLGEQVLKLQDTADAQAALNLLLGTQLNISPQEEQSASAIPMQQMLAQPGPLPRLATREAGGDQVVGSWSARSGTASEHLGALLQAYNSPKNSLSPLLSGDVAGGSGPGSANNVGPSRFSGLQAESSAAALGGLHENIFGAGGSGASTPRAAGPAGQLFDATVGSPCHSRTGSLSGSITGLAGAIGSQDPKVNLRMSNGSLGDLARGQRKHEPSKLRNSSNHPDFSDPSLELLGIVPDTAQASALKDALTGLPQGLLPSMLPPGMSPEQQAAAAMAGMTPDSMAALLASNQAAAAAAAGGMPNQLHAMYMAAMYPFYAQQAMQAAAAGAYPGFMGMPPMMPYPGFPMMPPGIGDVRPQGFPVMGPGGYPGPLPGMSGFSPMPGMVPPDFAAYYHKMMEAQAQASVMAAAAAGGGGGGMKDDGEGDLDGLHRHLHGLGADVMSSGSPLRGRLNRLADDRSRDMSAERGRRGGGRDSPNHRRGDRDGPGSAPGSARKSGRRDDDRRVDAVLEEFKNNKSKRFEFKDIFGHIFEFSLDQHGSRFIQQKLEVVGLDELKVAFDEVQPRILALMTDVFGNYVVQKFLDHGSEQHRLKLAGHLKGNVLSLSLQMYGCRVIQKALEVLPVENQCEMVAELEGQVMRCVRDQNGNHVIQKIIECVPTERILHLIDSFLTCVVPLSSHPFGCRVIQRILEHCEDAKRRAVVMDEILKSTCQLAQDQYGNYVIQHVLEHGSPQERMQVVTQLAPEIVPMSMHKFASNVVEKCLTYCSVAERDVLIQSMLGNHDHGEEEDPLQQMMKDQFGNYVVQKVLEVCDDTQRDRLLSRVRLQLHALKKYTYGKHIVARVEKLLAAGTKLQSSKLLNGSRPLPDDSELQALQLMQQLQQLQATGGGAAAGIDAAATGAERSSAPAGPSKEAPEVAVAAEPALPGRSSMPETGQSDGTGAPTRLVGSDTGDAAAGTGTAVAEATAPAAAAEVANEAPPAASA